jgi:uncharacterized lipoprotein YajG
MPLAVMIIQLVMPLVVSLLDWAGKVILAWIEGRSRKAIDSHIATIEACTGARPATLTGDQSVAIMESAFSQVRHDLGARGYRVARKALHKSDVEIDELIREVVAAELFKRGAP